MENSRRLGFQLSRNVFIVALGYVIPMSLALASTAFVVGRLGVELYGTWLTLQALKTLFRLADLGLTPSLVKFVAEFHATGEKRKIDDLIRLATFYFGSVGLISAVLMIVLARWFAHIFSLPDIESSSTQFIFTASAMSVLFQSISTPPRAVAVGLQKLDLTAGLELIFETGIILSNVLVLALGGGLIALVSLDAIFSLVQTLSLFRLAYSLVPGLSFRPSFQVASLKQTLALSISNIVIFFWGRLIGFGDRIFIGLFLGPQAITFFSPADRLAIQLHTFLFEATSFLLPLVSSLTAKGEKEKVKRAFLMTSKGVALVSFAMAYPLFAGAPVLFQQWLGGAFEINSAPILQIQAFAYALLALLTPAYSILAGGGRARILGIWFGASAVLLSAIYAVVIPRLGLIGAPYAFLAFMVLNITFYFFYIWPQILRLSIHEACRSLTPALLGLFGGVAVDSQIHLFARLQTLSTVVLTMGVYFFVVTLIGLVGDLLLNGSASIPSFLWPRIRAELMFIYTRRR